jgi:hypothetical protein
MEQVTPVAAEKKPIDPMTAAVDLLRLERIEHDLVRRVEAVRDRNIAFPSELTQNQLDKLVAEHESVAALVEELKLFLEPHRALHA